MHTRSTSSWILAALTTLVATLTFAQAASADSITVAWDANPEVEVVGYIVHVGTQPGTYTQHVDVGPATTWTFASAVAGQRYCFAVSAYYAGPIEGPRSNEVCGFSNAPPVLANPGNQTATVGQSTTLQLAGSDPKGDPVSYSATGLPPGLTLMGSTGYISGTPTTAGTYAVTAQVSDGVLTATQSFTWTVVALDTTAPAVTITGPTSSSTWATSTATVTLGGTASDNTGVTQVSWVNSRGGSGIASGTSGWTVAGITLQSGTNVLTVTARDAAGNTASDVLTVTLNGAPTLATVSNQSSVAGLQTTLQLVGSDPNGDALSYGATGLPSGLAVAVSTGLISGTPAIAGTYAVTVTVSDGTLSATRSFTWTVTGGASGGTLRLAWDAVADPNVIGYKVYVGTQPGVYTQNVDAGLTTTWTLPNPVAGQLYCFAVAAYVAGPLEGSKSNEVCGYSNRPPTLASVGSQTSMVGQAATLQLAGTDPDGSVLSYGATGLPSGLSVTVSTGLIAGTPTAAGTYAVTASVSDGSQTATQTFTWTISGETVVPVIAITAPTTAATWATSTATVTLGGTASDNVAVTQVSWVNSRGGSGTASGTSSWTAAGITLQSGTNVLTVTARDAAGNTASDVLTVTLNGAPTLAAVSNQSSAAGLQTTLQLVGSDPNGDALIYSATGLPSGLAVAVSTGLISGTPATAGTYPVTVAVSDGTLSATRSFTWTVTAETVAPVVTITSPTSAATFATSTASVTVGGTASDNVAVTQVSWVNSRGGSGTASGTTNWTAAGITLQSGANVLTVTARDAAGNTATDVLTVTLNVAPTLASVANQSTGEGQAATLQLNAADADGDLLTFGAMGLPPGMGVVVSSGLVTGTPTTAGTYAVTVSVSDGALDATRSFTWTVTAETVAPVVTITSPTSAATFATSNTTVTLGGTASDNVAVTQVSWVNSRGGSGVASGTSSWTAAVALQSGVNVLTVTARDAAGNTTTDVLTVTLNVAPSLAVVANQSTQEGQSATVQLTGADADGDVLTYTAAGLPGGLSVGVSNGLITGTPTTAGTYAVTVTVSDGALDATRSFTWTVTAETVAPVVTIASPTSAATFATSTATVTLGGTASDNVAVTQVSWVNSRGGSGVASGTSSWTAAVALQSGVNVLTVTARDAAGNTTTDVLTVTLNVAPSLAAVANQSTQEGQSATVQLTGADADGDVLTYSAAGLPAGLSVSVSNGLITGTPTTAGTYAVTVTVSDGALTATRSFTWTVTAETVAPVVTITSPTSAATFATSSAAVTVGGTASDNVAVTQVSWVNSRGGSGTATGTTSWTASVALQSGVNVLTVTARDAAGNTTTDVLTVTLNVAPTLASVANQSTEHGRSASLQLNGADAGGDTLTYSATGLPAGLTIAASSGLISGTPTTVGTYAVTATVSDGALSAARSFTWTVTAETVAPVVTITSPTSATTFATSSATVTVGGTASDNVAVTQVSWVNSRGGSGVATGTTTWTAAGITLQSGTNVLTVTARDAAGNVSTDILTVTYATTGDTTAPVVTITSPTSSSTYSTKKSTVALGGTASDAVGVTQVSWVNSRGGSGTASGTTSWSVSGIVLQNGVNVLTVTARDAAGNTTTDTLEVTYAGPLVVKSLTADRPAPQRVGTAITFTAVAEGSTGPYEYMWRLFDGTSWVNLTGWSASNQFTWTPSQARSSYQMRVVVRSASEATTAAVMAFPIVP